MGWGRSEGKELGCRLVELLCEVWRVEFEDLCDCFEDVGEEGRFVAAVSRFIGEVSREEVWGVGFDHQSV